MPRVPGRGAAAAPSPRARGICRRTRRPTRVAAVRGLRKIVLWRFQTGFESYQPGLVPATLGEWRGFVAEVGRCDDSELTSGLTEPSLGRVRVRAPPANCGGKHRLPRRPPDQKSSTSSRSTASFDAASRSSSIGVSPPRGREFFRTRPREAENKSQQALASYKHDLGRAPSLREPRGPVVVNVAGARGVLATHALLVFVGGLAEGVAVLACAVTKLHVAFNMPYMLSKF